MDYVKRYERIEVVVLQVFVPRHAVRCEEGNEKHAVVNRDCDVDYVTENNVWNSTVFVCELPISTRSG